MFFLSLLMAYWHVTSTTKRFFCLTDIQLSFIALPCFVATELLFFFLLEKETCCSCSKATFLQEQSGQRPCQLKINCLLGLLLASRVVIIFLLYQRNMHSLVVFFLLQHLFISCTSNCAVLLLAYFICARSCLVQQCQVLQSILTINYGYQIKAVQKTNSTTPTLYYKKTSHTFMSVSTDHIQYRY